MGLRCYHYVAAEHQQPEKIDLHGRRHSCGHKVSDCEFRDMHALFERQDFARVSEGRPLIGVI